MALPSLNELLPFLSFSPIRKEEKEQSRGGEVGTIAYDKKGRVAMDRKSEMSFLVNERKKEEEERKNLL